LIDRQYNDQKQKTKGQTITKIKTLLRR
jgi:hypothetical protein